MNEKSLLQSVRIERLGALLLAATTVFVAFLAINEIRAVFTPEPPMGTSISVSGTGSVFAVPDIAHITFTVREEADTATEAQETAATKVNTALALLGDLNIEERDIQTTSYTVFPRYSVVRPCFGEFCPPQESEIIGYTTTQTVAIKVRDTNSVGEILTRLGSTGVSDLSGPNFVIDDMDSLREEARMIAIADAKEKAEALARELGVRLTRVSGFWEDMGPYYDYGFERSMVGFSGDQLAPAIPELPVGENEIVVTVNISYEIR